MSSRRSRSVDTVSQRPVDLSLLAVAVVWGSSYLAAKEVVTADGVFGFLALRFGIAAAGLAIILAPRLRGLTRAEVALGVVFGAILSVIFALETFGVTMTSASNAGLIISLTIVMTPLLEQWVRRTQLPPAFYGATVVAVAGVGLLTQSGGLSLPGPGDLLIFLAAAARAVHVTVIAHLTQRRAVDSARVTLVQLSTGLAVFASLSTFTGTNMVRTAVEMSASSWLVTIYLAIVGTVFAFFIQIWAVRRTSPARVSLLLGTEPLWAVAIGILLGGEALTVVGAVGGVLILLGTNWGRTIDTRRTRTGPISAPTTESVCTQRH